MEGGESESEGEELLVSATPHFHSHFLRLQVGVTRTEHGRKAGHFHFAAFAFARLLEGAMLPHGLENAFAIDFLF